ncbi:MAG TPA: GH116 family glycosyl hydrolase, partial [Armatimonadota bacterium]
DELWNGDFFVNYYDSANQRQCPNSHFSQVAGEFYARLCGLGPLYGDHYVKQALSSMLRLNYHPRLKFPTNEATPEGKMSTRFMWGWLPHARVYLGGTPMYFGMTEEGLEVLERMEGVLRDINNDNRWDLRLFYEPDTGREHWGRFYMTAPATWYVYQALLGYRWDGPAGLLALLPNLPERLLPFEGPLFLPDLWAWVTISGDGATINLEVIKRFGDVPAVQTLCLRSHPGTLTVTADNHLVPVQQTASPQEGVEACYTCAMDLNQVSNITIEYA